MARSQDHAVASRRDHRPLEPQLREPVAHAHHTRRHLGRAVVRLHVCPVLERLQLVELHVEPVGDRVYARRDEDVAAPDLPPLDAREGDRDATAGLRPVDGAVVNLDAAHADVQTGRLDAQRVARADRAGPQRSGHDGADARE